MAVMTRKRLVILSTVAICGIGAGFTFLYWFWILPEENLPWVNYREIGNKLRGTEVPPNQNFYAGLLELIPDETPEFPDTRISIMKEMHVEEPAVDAPRFDLRDPSEEFGEAVSAGFEKLRRVASQLNGRVEVKGWLTRNTPPIKIMRAVARRPHAWQPLPSTFSTLLEPLMAGLSSLRKLAPLYYFRVFQQLEENRVDDATEDLLTLLYISRHVAQGPSPLDHLYAMAIERWAIEIAAVWAVHPAVTAEQRARFLEAFQRLKPYRPLDEILDHYERFSANQLAEWFCRPGGTREDVCQGLSIPGGEGSPGVSSDVVSWLFRNRLSFDHKIVNAEINRVYDEWVMLARRPYSPTILFDIQELRKSSRLDESRTQWGYLLLPRSTRSRQIAREIENATTDSLPQFLLVKDCVTVQHHLLLIAFAVVDFHEKDGSWPRSILQLPENISGLNDPFTNTIYRLHLQSGSLKIYSRGPDAVDHVLGAQESEESDDRILILHFADRE